MALPPRLRDTFLAEEVAFVAGQVEEIDIVPLYAMDRLRTISGLYGPFTPPTKCKLPLWLAVQLKKKGACRIVSPEWMAVERLEKYLQEETTQAYFSDLPPRYMETSRSILEVASDDVPSVEKVRSLLKDLREVRQSKMTIEAVDGVHTQVDNLSFLELNEIRPAYTLAFKRLLQLDPAEAQRVDDAQLGDAFD